MALREILYFDTSGYTKLTLDDHTQIQAYLALSDDADVSGTAATQTLTSADGTKLTLQTNSGETDATTKVLLINDSSGAEVFSVAGDGDTTLQKDMVIEGNLTVNGTTTTIDSELQTADRFVLFNSAYTGAAGVTGGFTVVSDPAASTFSISSIDGSTEIITVSTDPTSALAPGDIISIANPANPDNSGLREVSAVTTAPNEITIKTVPDSSVTGIVGTDLVTDATAQGTVVQVGISIMQADSAGSKFQMGFGDATPITFQDVADTTSGGGWTDDGTTVRLTTSTDEVAIGTATPLGKLTVDGDADEIQTVIQAHSTQTANLVEFQNSSATALVSISGTGTLAATQGITNSGGEVLLSGGNMQLNDSIQFSAGTSDDFTIVHGGTNTNITSTTGDLIIDNSAATGSTIQRLGTDTSATDFQVQNDSAASIMTLTGASVATFTVADNTTDAFLVQQGANAYLDITTTDGSEAMNFGNATTNPAYNYLGSGLLTGPTGGILLGDSAGGTNTYFVGTDSDGLFNFDGTNVQIQSKAGATSDSPTIDGGSGGGIPGSAATAGGASGNADWKTGDGGDVTSGTTGAGGLSGDLNFTTGDGGDVDAGTGDGGNSGSLNINVGSAGVASGSGSNGTLGAINIGTAGGAGALNLGTVGARVITIVNSGATSMAIDAGTGALTIDADSASSWTIGGNLTLSLGTNTLAVEGAITSDEGFGLGYTLTASGAIGAGDLVYGNGGTDTVSSAVASGAATSRVIGVAPSAISNSATGKVTTSVGSRVDVNSNGSEDWTVNEPVYLDQSNAGKVTNVKPGSGTIKMVGFASQTDGGAGTAHKMWFQPSADNTV